MHRTRALIVLAIAAPATAGTTFYGPTEYLSEADSPFASLDGFTLENFESGALSIAGISGSAGSVLDPSGFTDSVDGDDGSIDGFGRGGYSWFSANGSAGVTFTFDASVLGFLPTYAGIVWTDGAGTTTLEAFDAAGNSLGTVSGNSADGSFGGTTAEDRFYGAEYAPGIAAIKISNTGGGIEVDHLQFAIPAPSSLTGILAAGLLALRRRRLA